MSLQERGKVTEILMPQNGVSKAGKEWNKRDFVIETLDQYPKTICFTMFGDKATVLNDIKVGDTVDVYFNVESREFEGRYFHNINGWKVEVDVSVENTHGSVPPEMDKSYSDEMPTQGEPEGSDLPF